MHDAFVTDDAPSDRAAALDQVAAAVEGRAATDVLRWAAKRYGSRLTCATGFGPEGCVLVDLIGRERLPIDLFTLDTGLFFDETHALWRDLESRYGLTIRRVRPRLPVDEQARVHGERLWERVPDRCCAIRKVEPLGAELLRCDAWITAIRRVQTPQRAGARTVEWDAKFGLVKINPLVGWTKREVWSHLREHDVPYNPLHDLGYPSIGCRPCTTPVRSGEDDRSGRWRGCAKTECGLHDRTMVAVRGSR